jgi:hypothetical protein
MRQVVATRPASSHCHHSGIGRLLRCGPGLVIDSMMLPLRQRCADRVTYGHASLSAPYFRMCGPEQQIRVASRSKNSWHDAIQLKPATVHLVTIVNGNYSPSESAGARRVRYPKQSISKRLIVTLTLLCMMEIYVCASRYRFCVVTDGMDTGGGIKSAADLTPSGYACRGKCKAGETGEV